MDNQEKPKWYFKTWSLLGSFLCVGPFMLPLVWTNPRFSKNTKIIITIVVLAVTYIMSAFLVKSLKSITDFYQLGFGNTNY
jgi:hypothetical protein